MTGDEIKKAMHEFKPVRYDGINYKRITAYIYRVVQTRRGTYKSVLQLELLDYCEHSVTIAPAEKVELI